LEHYFCLFMFLLWHWVTIEIYGAKLFVVVSSIAGYLLKIVWHYETGNLNIVQIQESHSIVTCIHVALPDESLLKVALTLPRSRVYTLIFHVFKVNWFAYHYYFRSKQTSPNLSVAFQYYYMKLFLVQNFVESRLTICHNFIVNSNI